SQPSLRSARAQDGQREVLNRGQRGVHREGVFDPAHCVGTAVPEANNGRNGITGDVVAADGGRVDGLVDGTVLEGGLRRHLAPQGGDDLVRRASADARQLREGGAV